MIHVPCHARSGARPFHPRGPGGERGESGGIPFRRREIQFSGGPRPRGFPRGVGRIDGRRPAGARKARNFRSGMASTERIAEFRKRNSGCEKARGQPVSGVVFRVCRDAGRAACANPRSVHTADRCGTAARSASRGRLIDPGSPRQRPGIRESGRRHRISVGGPDSRLPKRESKPSGRESQGHTGGILCGLRQIEQAWS